MSEKSKSEGRQAVRIYLAHALDEFDLASFHAEELAWDDADRARVKAAFAAVRVQLVRLPRALPALHRCGSCRDTGKWSTGVECPACGGDHRTVECSLLRRGS